MAINLDILSTYYMLGLWEGLSPVPSFFKDRYFPTEAGDIFKSDKVLVEYRDGDYAMAPFMVARAKPINVGRNGYEIHEYAPTKIAQGKLLTIDDLEERGFGEAILSDSTEEQRAARLIADDLSELDRRLSRTEEWLCAQTIINNGFSVNEMIDKNTVGNVATVQFYDPNGTNDGLYTINSAKRWDAVGVDFRDVTADVRAMCRGLARRGLPATDLLVGVEVADALLNMADFRDLVNKQSGIIIGQVEETLTQYDGVTLLGVINFAGNRLNVITVDEQYRNADGTYSNYFPSKSITVTAPGAGHLMYGKITQMEDDKQYHTIAAKRVPKLFVDTDNDTRELRLQARPFAAPKNYSPWVYAADAVNG